MEMGFVCITWIILQVDLQAKRSCKCLIPDALAKVVLFRWGPVNKGWPLWVVPSVGHLMGNPLNRKSMKGLSC